MAQVTLPRFDGAQERMEPTYGVPRSLELKRILALPRVESNKLSPAFISLSTLFIKNNHLCSVPCLYGQNIHLLDIQKVMLNSAYNSQGLFAAVGVGHGKTLVTFLLPSVIISKQPILLVPSSLLKKTQRDWEISNRHFILPALTIGTYSDLSIASKCDFLEQLQPDLIIADEAHHFKRRESSRTRRFLRYMKQHPETKFCALSGSITSKSIRDYAHLIEAALKEGSPLPRGWREIETWAEALDPGGIRPPGALLELDDLSWGCSPQQQARYAFQRRLKATPGVVTTSESVIGQSIILSSLKIEDKVIDKALKQLYETWKIDDEEITDHAHLAQIAKQISLGFYYKWDWGLGGPDREWLYVRAEWNSAIRNRILKWAKPGLDSPLLIEQAAQRNELHSVEQEIYRRWSIQKQRIKQPPIKTVWISEKPVETIAQYGFKNRCVIWYEHQAILGKLIEKGIPCYMAGQDPIASETSVSLSIVSHSEGFNQLVSYSDNLITSPPANGKTWEQLLGRTHRQGQTADEVKVTVCLHTPAMRNAFDKALESARYIQETTGQKQKLLLTDWSNEIVTEAQ